MNPIDQQLEVHRKRSVAPLAPFGWRYGRREVLGVGASVPALAAPSALIAVADLLP